MDLPPAFSPPGGSAVPPVDFRASPVRFRHPAYKDVDSTLLLLDAFDKDKDGNYGLDYDVAFVSCGIVADNAFTSGWLATRTTDGFAPVPRPADNLLRGREYFFCVGDADPSTNKYDVIPSFDHWRFPHTLPSPWDKLQISSGDADTAVIFDSMSQVKARDKTCRISGHANGLETAHVIPVADGNWFHDNDMQRYCQNLRAPQPITDVRNMFVLRADLHNLFDARRFALVAKSVSPPAAAPPGPDSSAAVSLVLHVIAHNYSNELVHLYHNRPPQLIRGLAPEFLFARYAWSLFVDETYTFSRGNSRYNVLLFNRDKSQLEQDSLPAQAVRERMRMYPTYSASRSKSPKKRPRDQAPEEQTGADDDTVSSDEGSSSDEDTRPPRGSRPLTAVEIDAIQRRRFAYGDTAVSGDDEERRGRTMKRRFEKADEEASPPGLCSPLSTVSGPSGLTAPSGSPSEARAKVADGVGEDSRKRRRHLLGT